VVAPATKGDLPNDKYHHDTLSSLSKTKKQSTFSDCSALFSLAFLCYNNGNETAVYMIPWSGNGSLNVYYLKKASSSLG
jgi:hypothetical protein